MIKFWQSYILLTCTGLLNPIKYFLAARQGPLFYVILYFILFANPFLIPAQ